MTVTWVVWDIPTTTSEIAPRRVRSFRWRWTARVYVWRVTEQHRRHRCCHEGLLWQYRIAKAREEVTTFLS